LVLKKMTMSMLTRQACYCGDIGINSLRRLGPGYKFLVAAMQIADWLNALGLGRYAGTFAENGVDELSILRHLTDQDLAKLGVLLGHRRKMLAAIAELSRATPTAPESTANQPKPRDTAERRQLTVMFCDLIGSTELSTRLDPEELRAIIGAYHRCCTQLVDRNGGFVAKYMGDGVLAYFGYPVAHEDDAERAIRAGLALVQAVPKIATDTGTPLQLRIGIATGLVVVGDLIGAGAAQEQAVVGETPNLAARLQSVAAPNSIVIGPTTRGILGNLFEYQGLGRIEVKGFAAPVQAYQVLRPSSVESRFEALRTTATPLVGRHEEIELLMRRWQQAKEGDGSVVLISGEPGIGKSRIAQAVQDRLSTEEHTRLRYFCSPHHQDSALYPITVQLERAAGFRRDDGNEQRLTKLETVLAQATSDLEEAVPLLADLLSIATVHRYPVPSLSPQKRKERILKTFLAQVEGLAARGPVIMVFEDAHWIDPTSHEALDLIIDRVPALRILVIVTFRPEFIPPWVGREQVTLLSLNRLPPRQRADMITGVIDGKTLPKEIADQIIDRTDGIPLFIEELTKAVIESGVVADAGDHYRVTGPVTPLAIPTSLHASLLARLDRLAPVREVAQIAAALGRQFSHELISAVSGMPQQELGNALDQLVSSELIFRRGMSSDAEYTFKHALVQDAAYSTLLKSRRRQIHTKIGMTLEQKFPDIVTNQPALLAQHCTEAGLIEKAVGYWLKAGQQSVARSVMTEAVAQLQKGLELLANLPEGIERQKWELELTIAFGSALSASKGYAASEAGETLAKAQALAGQLGRLDYLIPLLAGMHTHHIVRAEHEQALQVAKQMEKIAQDHDDIALSLVAYSHHGFSRFYLGEFIAARALFEQSARSSDPAQRAFFEGITAEDPHAITLAYLAWTLTYMGFIDQARSCLNGPLSEARQRKHVYALVHMLNFASRISRLIGTSSYVNMDYPAVLIGVDQLNLDPCNSNAPGVMGDPKATLEALALSDEHGFAYYSANAMVDWGDWLTSFGKTHEAFALLTRALSIIRAAESIHSLPWALFSLAQAHAKLQRPIDGLNCLAEAEQIIQGGGQRRDEAELYRVRGDLLKAISEETAAEQNYKLALTVANRQSAKVLELRAAIGLARLWRAQGKLSEARDLLAPVYHWFTEGLNTQVLQDAKALLKSLEGKPSEDLLSVDSKSTSSCN
jgi:class 3 adenylate cyclase/tetratricopeptide (TPR) repeat protein